MTSMQKDKDDNSISSLESEEIQTEVVDENDNISKEDFSKQCQLKFELDRLNKDIKVCELYKKNLEKDIKDFKKCLSEKKYLENQIAFLKIELINLQKEQDMLKIENRTLNLENERLLKYKNTIKTDIDSVLQKFQEARNISDVNISYKETLKDEVITLEKNKDTLLEEISILKEEKIKINSEVEKLNMESNSLYDKFASELKKLKTELGLDNNTPSETEEVLL